MITEKLKQLFFLTVILSVLHSTEEFITGFDQIDIMITYLSSLFINTPQATFYVFQFMWWSLLFVILGFVYIKQFHLYVLSAFSFLYFFELHHIYKAIIVGGYYPGLITSFFFPVLGYFYIRELRSIRDKK